METIASLLQKQGYVTGGVGKWHMGTTDEQHPNAMGFDDWFGFLSGGSCISRSTIRTTKGGTIH